MLKSDTIARHIFTDLLLLANAETGEAKVGRNYLARVSGFHPSTVYKVLNRLKQAQMLEQQSNSKGTTILICNWGRWQQQSNSKVTLLKKKEERDRDKSLSCQKFDFEDKRLGDLLLDLVETNYPFLAKKDAERNRDYEAINKLHRLDNREYDLIERIIKWSQAHSFWKQNIRSCSKLREKFPELLVRAVEERKQQRRSHAG